jgi:DNA mismatch repair protein MutS
VTGANQGGKTTFACTFGQLHHLASLGCPDAGRRTQLFLFRPDVHPPRARENPDDLTGKLRDDLLRIRAILDQATGPSLNVEARPIRSGGLCTGPGS